MVTSANLDLLREQQIDWITALKAPQVKALRAAGVIPLSLFDERNMAEIEHKEYPGERLVVCRNPLLATERARTRKGFLHATEAKLRPVQERSSAEPCVGKTRSVSCHSFFVWRFVTESKGRELEDMTTSL
jgi:hypothetical protein